MIPAELLLVERDALKPRFARIEVQPTLNPAVWDGDRMRGPIRERLLTIVQDFLTQDDTPALAVEDIVLTGSLANYNWSSQSDLDTHIMARFPEGDVGTLTHQLYRQLAAAWNTHHDITLAGFEVELYVETTAKPFTHDAGVYSLQRDTWVMKPPSMAEHTIDWEGVFKKANRISARVDRLDTLVKQGHYEAALHEADHLRARLRRQRAGGLEQGGELSVENLVFKVLRRHGDLERLRDLKTRAGDRAQSL